VAPAGRPYPCCTEPSVGCLRESRLLSAPATVTLGR
jgi:hypothetical protein